MSGRVSVALVGRQAVPRAAPPPSPPACSARSLALYGRRQKRVARRIPLFDVDAVQDADEIGARRRRRMPSNPKPNSGVWISSAYRGLTVVMRFGVGDAALQEADASPELQPIAR